MNNIYVSKDGQQHGPFSLEQVCEEVQSGYFSLADFAWWEGMADWVPIREILPRQTQPTPKIATPTQPAARVAVSVSKLPIEKSKFLPLVIGGIIGIIVCAAILFFCLNTSPKNSFSNVVKTLKSNKFASDEFANTWTLSDIEYDISKTDSLTSPLQATVKANVFLDNNKEKTGTIIAVFLYTNDRWTFSEVTKFQNSNQDPDFRRFESGYIKRFDCELKQFFAGTTQQAGETSSRSEARNFAVMASAARGAGYTNTWTSKEAAIKDLRNGITVESGGTSSGPFKVSGLDDKQVEAASKYLELVEDNLKYVP